jgi:hypothetical protein
MMMMMMMMMMNSIFIVTLGMGDILCNNYEFAETCTWGPNSRKKPTFSRFTEWLHKLQHVICRTVQKWHLGKTCNLHFDKAWKNAHTLTDAKPQPCTKLAPTVVPLWGIYCAIIKVCTPSKKTHLSKKKSAA